MIALGPAAGVAGDFTAVDYERNTIYRSPSVPAYTCWVGAWSMPDGSLMTSFTQATGPVGERKKAPESVRKKLNWPPAEGAEYEQFDMTGLDLRNVHLRSRDAGRTWEKAGEDPFQTCMNGVSGEAETALTDGTVIRGVFGLFLPYNPELPSTGYLQRSTDGTRTWSTPTVPLDPKQYTCWPRRLRLLRDGRLLLLSGVARGAAKTMTRSELGLRTIPMILVSRDAGRTWSEPIPAVGPGEQQGWTEEFDVAELPNGDLLAIFRRAQGTHRRQGRLRKQAQTWVAELTRDSTLPHSGHPELLSAREGPVLHLATTGIDCTLDEGETWRRLELPGTAYYPRSLQLADGEILVFGHIGADDGYDRADQSIVLDRFRLHRK